MAGNVGTAPNKMVKERIYFNKFFILLLHRTVNDKYNRAQKNPTINYVI